MQTSSDTQVGDGNKVCYCTQGDSRTQGVGDPQRGSPG